jgi:hypothetical protein
MQEHCQTVETCDCAENEAENRRTILIEADNSPDELKLTLIYNNGTREGPEIVTKGQVTTSAGRSFHELLIFGPGLHSICDCRQIGPKPAVFKPLPKQQE